jgi:hypothetical protein
MAEIVQSLFGITPEMYQQSQQARADQQALQYAQLTPFQQANFAIGRGANMLGGAIGRGLGGEDPELARITMRQQIASRINPNDLASVQQGILALSQGGDPQGAMMLQGEYRKLVESNALVGQRSAAEKASLAQAAKTELTNKQEEELRNKLSKLVNPTEEDILAVVTQYGSPDKVLSSLTLKAERAAQREATLTLGRERIAAKLESDLRDAKNDKEREQARIDARKEIAQLVAASKTPPAPSLTTIVNPENPNETITVDARVYKGGGKGAEGVIGLGKPSATQEKATLLKAQMGKDIDFAITELTSVTKDGGLIDQSTGSGAGRLTDIGAGFFGQATPGAIAIGKLKPIQDLVLKMVPRFEGPQSDKDTQSYKEAAGQLADPTLPTKIRKEAGKTVLRLMQSRKNQFVSPELAAEGINTTQPSSVGRSLSAEDQQALNWANSNPNDPRSIQIKNRLGAN